MIFTHFMTKFFRPQLIDMHNAYLCLNNAKIQYGKYLFQLPTISDFTTIISVEKMVILFSGTEPKPLSRKRTEQKIFLYRKKERAARNTNENQQQKAKNVSHVVVCSF